MAPVSVPEHRPGEVAPTLAEAPTPGFTPPGSPALLPWQEVALLPWQEVGPPQVDPGDRGCSWLYTPLLHASAGLLAEAARAR